MTECPISMTVVVPTFQRVGDARICLAAMAEALAQVRGDADVEVVMTDDSRDIDTQIMIAREFPDSVRWHAGPRRGPAANRNSGAAASKREWLVFTDDDCIPSPGWLRAFVRSIRQRPDVRVFEGRTAPDRELQRHDEECPVNLAGGYLWSCNMAIRHDLFAELGGFCEEFPHAAMEDVDLRLRLSERGISFEFVADALVCHPVRRMKGLTFARKQGASYLHLARRHPDTYQEVPWSSLVLNGARRYSQLVRRIPVAGLRGIGLAACVHALGFYYSVRAKLDRRAIRSA